MKPRRHEFMLMPMLALTGLLICAVLPAQSPEKMSYQAVVRDVGGVLLSSQNVGIRIQILQTTEFGAAVYVETHTRPTNSNGLVTLEIGGGSVVMGSFSGINWNNGPYFLKTEIDPGGGTSYSIIGTTQLMSVPYALQAKSVTIEADPAFTVSPAAGITGSNITNWNNAHTHSTKTTGSVHGSTIVGDNLLRLTNPSAISFLRINADNSVNSLNPTDFRISIGAGTGTVTSIATGNGITGGTINTTGAIGLTGQALALHNLSNNGIIVRTGTGTVATRTITSGTGITVSNGDGVSGNPSIAAKTYTIGDFAHGGIVFWVDETGQHGLVCAKTDQNGGVGVKWHAGTNSYTMAMGNGMMAGKMNTMIIISTLGRGDATSYAARICNELQITEGGITYGDWYLPSSAELSMIWLYSVSISTTSIANGGTSIASDWYWSSTEYDINHAFLMGFHTGSNTFSSKAGFCRVRAIRSF